MKPKFLAKSIASLIATSVTLTSALHALPQGEQVKAGTAAFSRAGGALNIRTSDRAIINYQSFNIGSAERVNFIQPSAQSITLNRVTAPNPSQILGALSSNGQIVLANPVRDLFRQRRGGKCGRFDRGRGAHRGFGFSRGADQFFELERRYREPREHHRGQ